jgi:hypothetical protein
MHRVFIEQVLLFGFTDNQPLEADSSPDHQPDEAQSATSLMGESNRMNEIKRVRGICGEILASESNLRARDQQMSARIEEEIHRLQGRRHELLAADLFERQKKYVETKYQIALLTISKHLRTLSDNSDVRLIPAQVIEILDTITADMHIPSQSIIRKKMTKQCQAISAKILRQFHELFESQLVASTNLDTTNRSEKVASNSLDTFFSQAKDWMLAYAMVSMLPFAISTESKSQCLMKYQEVLDESLTPLWGRFHFHLQSSRDTNAIDQILWSFSYARSFVDLLTGICRNISDTGRLQRLYAGDYHILGMQYVIDKAMRFMRSHVVKLLEDYSSSSRWFEDANHRLLITSIIESSLEFDDNIADILPTDLPVGGAVFDIKSVHAYWVDLDHTYFYQRITKSINNIRETYTAQFGSNILGKHSWFPSSSSSNGLLGGEPCLPFIESDFQVKYSGYRCYHGVYDCLSMLHIACKRYMRLSSPSQDIFAAVIIEPLILLSVAVLLYRIQTNKFLHRLSIGAPTSSRNDEIPIQDDVETFAILSEFIASAQYLQSGLNALPTQSHDIKVRESRFEERWDLMQEWLPKRYMEEKYLNQRTTSLQGLVHTVFQVPGWRVSRMDDISSSKQQAEGFGDGSLGTYLTNRKSAGVMTGKLGKIIEKVKKCIGDICLQLESRYLQR